MSSASLTRTDAAKSGRAGVPSSGHAFPLWQLYALLGMLAAAAAVWTARHTHPVALVLLSAAAIAAAVVALAVHHAAAAFFSRTDELPPLGDRQRALLEREKALTLRSIKELEFDRAMGKIGEEDFVAMSSRLRARALTLMQDLERAPAGPPPAAHRRTAPSEARQTCAACGTANETDAKFCKHCGGALKNSPIMNSES